MRKMFVMIVITLVLASIVLVNIALGAIGAYFGYKYSQPNATTGKDAYIRGDSGNTNKNYGNMTAGNVGPYSGSELRYLIEFDLSDIPSDAVVTNTNLTMTTSKTMSNDLNVSAHRITSSWAEGSGNGDPNNSTINGTTWNERWNDTSWSSAGGDFSATAEIVTNISRSANQATVFNITDLVQSWVNGSYNNYGVILKEDVGNDYTAFYTSDYNETISYRPRIRVDYKIPDQNWTEDTNKTMDLTNYFRCDDPPPTCPGPFEFSLDHDFLYGMFIDNFWGHENYAYPDGWTNQTIRRLWVINEQYQTNGADDYIMIADDTNATNYIVEANVSLGDINWENASLIFRFQDINNYYYFKINQTVGMESEENNIFFGGYISGVNVETGMREEINSDQWYKLKVVVNNTNFTGYIDGVQKLTWSNDSLTKGKMGLGIEAIESIVGGDEAAFDNVRQVELVDNMTVSISSWAEIAVLAPKANFYGTRYIAFSTNTTTVADSNIVKLDIPNDFADCFDLAGEGDKKINTTLVCENMEITTQGNITIQDNGNITFRNVTLVINNSENGEHGIRVLSEGKFYIYDNDNNKDTTNDASNITAFNTANEFFFIVDSGSTFEMKNSRMSEAGWTTTIGKRGLEINTTNSEIIGNYLYNNMYVLVLYSDYNIIEGNNVSSPLVPSYGLYIANSSNNSIKNNTMDGNNWQTYSIYMENSSYNNITDNVLTGVGIAIGGSSDFDIIMLENSSYNNIINNSLIGIPDTDNALSLRAGSNYNNITNNTAYSAKCGFLLNNSQYNVIDGNEVYNHTIEAGIKILDSANDNKVINNSFYDDKDGIIIEDSNNNTLINNTINNTRYGVWFDNAIQNLLQNSVIENSTTFDIYSLNINSNNTFLNTIFNKSSANITNGTIWVKWYLDVYVTDNASSPIENANVTAWDNSNVLAFSELTKESGYITQQNLTEYFQNSTTTNYSTKYEVNITKTSYSKSTRQLNITNSTTLTFMLTGPPISVDTSDPNSPWNNNTDVNVSINVTDYSGTGISWTRYCTDDYNFNLNPKVNCSAYCEPDDGIQSNNTNMTNITVTCPQNSACGKVVRYYSRDNSGNTEDTKKCSYPILISNGHIVDDFNMTNCTITNNATLKHVICENSTIDGCYVENAIINVSYLEQVAGYSYDCRVIDSNVSYTNLTNGFLKNSTVEDPSRVLDSLLDTSITPNTTVRYSEVQDSTFCSGIDAFGAAVLLDLLSAGRIIYSNNYYYAPANITQICANITPQPVGTLEAIPSTAKDNTSLIIKYHGQGVGYNVTLNTSPLNSANTTITLTDDGISPDETVDDAIYTGSFTINMTGDENKTLVATITALGNIFYANTTVVLDNTEPNATIQIFSLDGNTTVTNYRTVTLNLSYIDLNGIKECRYSNDNFSSNEQWEGCATTKAWLLTQSYGNKTVYYQVKDNANNIKDAEATISYEPGAGDSTPPTQPTVYDGLEVDDIDFSNANTTLSAHWFNSTDYESTVLYRYKLYENNSCIAGYCNWIDTGTEIEVTVTGLTLLEGNNYTFEVMAYNTAGLNSTTAFSDGVIIDYTAPQVTLLNSSTHPDNTTYYSSTDPQFNWTATDQSGIKGYSYIIDQTLTTVPDSIIDTTAKSVNYSGISDGTWYFHIKVQDNATNWGNTSTFMININTTGVAIRINSPTDNQIFYTTTINVSGYVSENALLDLYAQHADGSNYTDSQTTSGNFTFTNVQIENNTNVIYVNATANNLTTKSNIVHAVLKLTNLTFTITYNIAGSSRTTHIVEKTYADYTLGIASESSSTTTATASPMSVIAGTDKPSYIFMTRPGADLTTREESLGIQQFLDLISPSFGYPLDVDKEYVVSLILNYPDIKIEGSREVAAGKYTLKVLNNGLTSDGKINLTVSIT